jgi:hypothetical protein
MPVREGPAQPVPPPTEPSPAEPARASDPFTFLRTPAGRALVIGGLIACVVLTHVLNAMH